MVPKVYIETTVLGYLTARMSRDIAIAVTNGVEFLLTWNLKHIANATMRSRIEAVCREAGYEPAVICTPEEILER